MKSETLAFDAGTGPLGVEGSTGAAIATRGPEAIVASGSAQSVGGPPRPFCVDMDGTLILTDALIEGLAAIVADPRALLQLAGTGDWSRARLKQRVAQLAKLSPELLPYNDAVLEQIRKKRAAGHRIVLATAADETVARAVADHLGVFDEVIASDGNTNLKGEAKAAALTMRFGRGGFDYAGNDANDIPVWRESAEIVIVNAPARVKTAARLLGPPVTEIDSRAPLARSLLRALRPHQWCKNLLVFVPMVAAHALGDAGSWAMALIMLCAFSATASAIYIVNDLLDLSADRQHPRKRHRPLASGAVPIPLAAAVAAALLVVGTALATTAGAIGILALYAALSFGYSLGLKRFPLVDVFVLAALYTLRVLGGGVATGHRASLWLLTFSGFTFLSLALVKRVSELQARSSRADMRQSTRRGYLSEDLQILQMLGCASAFASSVVLSLFIGSTSAILNYQAPEVLWLLVPLILFWQCRLWLATARASMHDDPIVFAARDWVSWLVAGATLLIAMIATLGLVSFS